MPTRMTEAKIAEIVDIATKAGYVAQTKDNGERRYVKNLKLVSGRLTYPVYVHLQTGVSEEYLKVAVHPDSWCDAVLAPSSGIAVLLNDRKKTVYFSGSNWDAFRCRDGSKESVARCYRVDTPGGNLETFSRLLHGLAVA